MPLLKVDRLSFAYGDLRVLTDVSIEVREREIATVVGANGAGKSTLLKNISRLFPGRPLGGSITFDGKDLLTMAPHEVVDLGVVQVPEARRIFPEMTVAENLRLGSFARRAHAKRAQNLDKVLAMFPRLKERSSQLGGTLSGGEQQMLAIGRGLMADPKVLLMDEPSLGLAPLLVKQMFDAIAEINRTGVTVLLVEQNVRQSLKLASRGYVLETGRTVLSGTGAELLDDPQVQKAFLGI
jgi:branched-chain amino acid transport system ATP-binding protein